MQTWTLPLSPDLPVELAGRKAATLGRLAGAGFPVPPGVCIPTGAFRAAVETASPPGDLRLPDGLLDELARGLPMDAPLAVRTSAVREDLPDASLAGRYATVLNVAGAAALEQAVLACWRSYRCAVDPEACGAHPTRAPHAGPAGADGCAVLVQPLLESECAGVCFSVDPVRLQAGLLLVVSGWGQGAGVVSGAVPTDTARLRRMDLSAAEQSTADKHTALRPAPSGGITAVPVPPEQRAIPCLPPGWLERVGQYGLALEQFFGAPQDVEWAIAGGQVWILQSRPITALPAETRAAARFPLAWENEIEPRHSWWLVDPDPPLLPAQLSFRRASTLGSLDAVYFRGGEKTRWIKYLHGRMYMTVAPSANSPGRTRIFQAAMRDLGERLTRTGVTLWEHAGPEVELATARLAAFDPRGAGGPALADYLEDTLAASTRHWMVHTMHMGPRPIRSAALLDLYAQLAGQPGEALAAQIPFLLAGEDTIQTRLVEALYDLACLALEDPDAAREAALQGSSSTEPFAREFQALLHVYGGRVCRRAVPGFSIELPMAWKDAPEHLWELVAAYLPLARQGADPRAAREKARREGNARVAAICAQASANGCDPALVAGFRRTLAYARRNAAGLDEHNHYIDQLSEGQYLQALLSAGRWLAARGSLESPFDAYWLDAGEVLAALRGETPVRLDEVVAARRAEYAAWQALCPPACLGMPEPELPQRPPAPAPESLPARPAPDPAGQAGRLTGEPASRGRASGPARVADGSLALPKITPGDVLVAAWMPFDWIPVLPALAALVLDSGGPGDHAALTAREFGLPAVCATHNATLRIPPGARVTVDADAGVVTWEVE